METYKCDIAQLSGAESSLIAVMPRNRIGDSARVERAHRAAEYIADWLKQFGDYSFEESLEEVDFPIEDCHNYSGLSVDSIIAFINEYN